MLMFYLTIVNKMLRHCHFWLARQYVLLSGGLANVNFTRRSSRKHSLNTA